MQIVRAVQGAEDRPDGAVHDERVGAGELLATGTGDERAEIGGVALMVADEPLDQLDLVGAEHVETDRCLVHGERGVLE